MDSKSLTIRVPLDLYQRLDAKRYKTKSTLQDVALRFFEAWVGAENDDVLTGLTPTQKQHLREYAEMLRMQTGHPLLIAAKHLVSESMANWRRAAAYVEERDGKPAKQ